MHAVMPDVGVHLARIYRRVAADVRTQKIRSGLPDAAVDALTALFRAHIVFVRQKSRQIRRGEGLQFTEIKWWSAIIKAESPSARKYGKISKQTGYSCR